MNISPVTLTKSISTTADPDDAVAGALCNALLQLGWKINRAKSDFSIEAVWIAEHSHLPKALVHIYQEKPATFRLQFDAGAAGISYEELNLLAEGLTATAQHTLDNSLHAALRVDFNRVLQAHEMKMLQHKTESRTNRLWWLVQLFITPHPMRAVAWIILINTVVFVLMAINGAGFMNVDATQAIAWGAAWKRPVLEGEYWRLLTACFVHFGLEHVISNMIGLLLAATFLMIILNQWQFLTGYIVTGVISSAVSMWWHSETVSAGASGAIFGCYGMLLGLILTPLLTPSDRVVIAIYLLLYGGFNLLYGLKDGIDNAAHVGGLLAGIPVGWIFYADIRWAKSRVAHLLIALAVIGFGAACSSFLIQHTTYYAFEFDRLESEYNLLEHQGLKFFKMADAPEQLKIKTLQQSVSDFTKAGSICDSLSRLDGLPDYERDYVAQLSVYNQYRLHEMNSHLQWYLSDDKAAWNDSIDFYYSRVDSMLQIFKAYH